MNTPNNNDKPADGHGQPPITFTLDGEDYTTVERKFTPNQILDQFGHKDAASYYLVEIKEHNKKSYKDEGDKEIELHNGQSFISVKIGPTPVSDLPRSGIEAFVEGLVALGYKPQIENRNENSGRVRFQYVVESGKHEGKEVELGFPVAGDFPMTPPGGPHVRPMIHGGVASGTNHPTSNIHSSEFGEGWEYWSRPFPGWQEERSKSVGTYMAYIRQLWATQ